MGDSCIDTSSKCLKRLSSIISINSEFATSCANAMVKFNVNDNILNLFKNGTQSGWQTIINVKSIGTTSILTMPKDFWTGDPGNTLNRSWIVGNISYPVSSTFSTSYSFNSGWNYCNSSPDTSSIIRLFYR